MIYRPADTQPCRLVYVLQIREFIQFMRPRGAIESIRVNSKAATGFLHLEIVKSGQVPFLGRNTMFWPFFLHLGVPPVEIGRCTNS